MSGRGTRRRTVSAGGSAILCVAVAVAVGGSGQWRYCGPLTFLVPVARWQATAARVLAWGER